ncbi:helix-turn-helix transcriptional regulator [Pedobacter jeongneungensis]|uniref:S24 family peptidase n=1 Tax=Pedobacter jeongneungensis TaxID=947309 RepID=UPI00046B0258|nr:S24 family peptidase [Pedobacter jeongneungensis]
MKNISTQKERIIQYLEIKGVSKNKFYNETGISNGVLDKSSGLTMDTVEKFYSKYRDINLEWLITGTGLMMKETQNPTNEQVAILNKKYLMRTDIKQELQEIPLYDFQAAAGLTSVFNEKANILDRIKIPNLPKCDGAISIVGDSMYPLLKSGDIVIYKVIQNFVENIFWGEMYLLSYSFDGDEMVTVKYIQKSEKGDEYIKLVSQNSNHQAKDIRIDGINSLALVKASIRINNMS